jgi:hypothetical protein
MTTANTLFIGGPWDGRRRVVELQHCLETPDAATYRLEYFNRHPAYVLEGMSHEEAAGRLLAGYKPWPEVSKAENAEPQSDVMTVSLMYYGEKQARAAAEQHVTILRAELATATAEKQRLEEKIRILENNAQTPAP